MFHWTGVLVPHLSVKGAELPYASQITCLLLYRIKSKEDGGQLIFNRKKRCQSLTRGVGKPSTGERTCLASVSSGSQQAPKGSTH